MLKFRVKGFEYPISHLELGFWELDFYSKLLVLSFLLILFPKMNLFPFFAFVSDLFC